MCARCPPAGPPAPQFFLLFLVYTFLACLVVTGLLIRPMIDFFSNSLKGPM